MMLSSRNERLRRNSSFAAGRDPLSSQDGNRLVDGGSGPPSRRTSEAPDGRRRGSTFSRRRSTAGLEGPQILDLHTAALKGSLADLQTLVKMGQDVNLKNADGYPVLHVAVEHGRTDAVRFLLEAKADPDAAASFGVRAVHIACALGNLDIVRALVEKGADYNARDADDSTPLHWAASSGKARVIDLLMRYDIDIFDVNSCGKTPMDIAEEEETRQLLEEARRAANPHELAAKGNQAMLARLLKSGHNGIDDRDAAGNSILHAACQAGQVTIAENLVYDWDADPTSRNRQGKTPLHVAAAKGQLETLKFLDIVGKPHDFATCACDRGYTMLHEAAKKGHDHIVAYVMDEMEGEVDCRDKTGKTPLHLACKYRRAGTVGLLLRYGADVDARDENRSAPLHMAAAFGGAEIVDKLLEEHRANGLARDVRRNMPLHIAVREGHLDIARVLVDRYRGTLHRSPDKKGPAAAGVPFLDAAGEEEWSPLHFGAIRGHDHVVRYLVGEGAAPGLKDSSGSLAIHLAAQEGHTAVLEGLCPHLPGVDDLTLAGFTALHLAARYGHLSALRYLLKRGADPNAAGPSGSTALLLAAEKGQTSCVRMLLRQGSNVNWENDLGNTCLHLACRLKNLPLVKAIVSTKAEPAALVNKPNNIEKTALQDAVMNSTFDVVEYLMAHGANGLVVDEFENTVLHYCCIGGNTPVLLKSLKRYMRFINARNLQRQTPMHVAAANGHSMIVERLVSYGGDIMLRDISGRTPLHLAVHFGHLDVVNALVLHATRYGEEPQLLGVTAEGDKLPLIRVVGQRIIERIEFSIYKMMYQLKQQMGYVNHVDSTTGQTAYHIAAERGHAEIVEYLDNRMGDADQKDKGGNTVLHAAATSGLPEIIAYLAEEAEADLNARNEYWYTPLYLAAEGGFAECVDILLRNGADHGQGRKDGARPMHVAALRGHHACVRLLLDAGADVDAKSIMRETPLHWGAKGGHQEAVRVLLAADAQYELKDNTDSCPMHWAADYGHTEAIALLIEKGAEVHMPGMWRGFYPLHLAARQGHDAATKLLARHTTHLNKGDLWNNSTPLHLAAEGGHLAVVQSLLARNARVDMVDKFNTTPADCATTEATREVIRSTAILRRSILMIHGATWDVIFRAWREKSAETRALKQRDAKETWKLVFSLFGDNEVKMYYRMWRQWEIRKRRKRNLESDDREWVVSRLRLNKAFQDISEKVLFAICEAMSTVKYRSSYRVMTRGDKGDNFYLLVDGICEVQIELPDGSNKRVQLERGASFGEMALLTDEPRNATIVSLTDVTLMSLDKHSFQMSINNPAFRDAANRVSEKFLAKVSLFQKVQSYHLVLLADLVTVESFLDGDAIVTQGELGDRFYIIVEGEAEARVAIKGQPEPRLVRQYMSGDFFGEMALVQDKPRGATVSAVGFVKCAVMDKFGYSQLPNSVQAELYDHIQTYSDGGSGVIERKAWTVSCLKQCSVFDGFNDRSLYALADAMFQIRKKAGEWVFEEGERGDNFYLILEGTCEIHLNKQGMRKRIPLEKGQYFGELALQYDQPRSAGVASKTDTVLLGLDRYMYQLSQSSQETRESILADRDGKVATVDEAFLEKVPIFQGVPSHEMVLLADLMQKKAFRPDTEIIAQGDIGDAFYIVMKGKAFASIEGVGAVREYEARGYFGEIALLRDTERAATVTARTKVVCAVLSRFAFEKLPSTVRQRMEEKIYMYSSVAPEIVPEMIEDLKDAFNLVDIDRGGDIDVTELKIAARSFGLEPTVEELEQMLNAMDEDGGGTIDLEEFTEAVAEELRRLCAREKVEEAFGFFDREGRGTIVFDDMKRVVEELGENVNDVELQAMMSLGEADLNDDGEIDPDEFFALVNMLEG